MSERTQRMLNRVPKSKEGNPICIERLKLDYATRSRCPNEPAVLVQGKVQKDLYENIPIFIMEDELIVGNGASKPYGVELTSGQGIWDQAEIRALRADGFPVSIEDEETLYKLNELGKPIGVAEGLEMAIQQSPRMEAFVESGIMLPPWKKPQAGVNRTGGCRAQSGLGPDPGWGFFCIDYEMVLKKGLLKLIDECTEEIEKLRYNEQDTFMRSLTMQAMKLCMEGIITLSKRFSVLAADMAKSEKNEKRKAELEQISEICAWVPANPARTFREAMQMYWFIFLCSVIPAQTTAMGRMDQFMYPYYKADIEAGRITNEEVIELFECLRIKCMEQESVYGAQGRKRHDGKAKWYTLTIGGCKPDGTDACNELTLDVLEAIQRCPCTHHTVSLRVTDTTPDEVMKKAVECQAKGLTMPAFIGDKSFIKYFTDAGATLEQARNYCISGCNDGVIPGLTLRVTVNMCVPLRMFEIWLNDGVDATSGMRIIDPVGDLDRFKTYEEFYSAFVKGMQEMEGLAGERINIQTMVLQALYPCPVPACFMTNGIKQGKALFEGDYETIDMSSFSPVGMVNLGESLYAVRKLVYEDHELTLSELKKILDSNWSGYEDLQQKCRKMPKFGNDLDEVDLIVQQIYNDWADGIDRISCGKGKYMRPAAISITAYDPAGAETGATPDGRSCGEIVADACASPCSGADHKGFLAVLKSAMKIPQERFSSFLFNQKFHPSALKTEEDYLKLGNAIKVYCDHYGKHIQFNVISREDMEDAQIHPEQHEDLMVRVAGYSAYFTILNKTIQDQLIDRTWQDSV